MPRATSRRAGVLGGALLLLACAGCARPGFERYVPPPDTARAALDAALGAWQKGRAPGLLEDRSPPVMVVDSLRRDQGLCRYEVLGEVPGEGPRCYAVRLVLDDPPRELKARFVVFGISPLWVYRQEDYDMLARWDCGSGAAAVDTAPADLR